MNNIFITMIFLGCLTLSVQAETNATVQTKEPTEANSTVKVKQNSESNETTSAKAKRVKEEVKEQMEREKKYAKEQSFAQGDDYDLSAHEVDPNALPDVPLIEPDYDFDITDVYRDDI